VSLKEKARTVREIKINKAKDLGSLKEQAKRITVSISIGLKYYSL